MAKLFDMSQGADQPFGLDETSERNQGPNQKAERNQNFPKLKRRKSKQKRKGTKKKFIRYQSVAFIPRAEAAAEQRV